MSRASAEGSGPRYGPTRLLTVHPRLIWGVWDREVQDLVRKADGVSVRRFPTRRTAAILADRLSARDRISKAATARKVARRRGRSA